MENLAAATTREPHAQARADLSVAQGLPTPIAALTCRTTSENFRGPMLSPLHRRPSDPCRAVPGATKIHEARGMRGPGGRMERIDPPLAALVRDGIPM